MYAKAKRPPQPHALTLAYTKVDHNGRIVAQSATLHLPPHCTTKQLHELVRDVIGASPRQPLELSHWGTVLPPTDAPLADAHPLTAHSQIRVLVKPKQLVSVVTEPLRRLRFRSRRLDRIVAVDGVSPATTVLELKERLVGCFKEEPHYCSQEGASADEKSGNMEVRKCETLLLVSKREKSLTLRRVRDSHEGTVSEADVQLIALAASGPRAMQLFWEGERLADDNALLSRYDLVHNDILSLEFKWPWEPDVEQLATLPSATVKKDTKAEGKGKKKKKK